ncbi:MAG: hypothetical protein JXQ99_21175 [Hyphomicrobiaceae bacterium]
MQNPPRKSRDAGLQFPFEAAPIDVHPTPGNLNPGVPTSLNEAAEAAWREHVQNYRLKPGTAAYESRLTRANEQAARGLDVHGKPLQDRIANVSPDRRSMFTDPFQAPPDLLLPPQQAQPKYPFAASDPKRRPARAGGFNAA